MSEENENKPTVSQSGFTGSSSEIESKLVQIEALQGKIRLIRWGLFIGVLAIMAIGISSIWGTTKKAAAPAVEVYKEAKVVYLDVSAKIETAENDYNRIENKVTKAQKNITDMFNRIEPKAIKASKIATDMFNRIEPKATKTYNTIKSLTDSSSKERMRLKAELKDRLEEDIKPAAEDLAKTILIDIQDEALEKFNEISAHSDEFMAIAHDEYNRLTNNIPNAVSEALEQTLVKTVNEREDKLREMFPNLTKEKQTAVISKLSDRLSNLSDEESEKIFIALFADHLSELGKLQDLLDAIYAKEGGAGGTKSGVESTLALLSSLIQIAMEEFDTGDKWEGPKKEPKEKNPDKLLKEKPKKEDASSDSQ